MEQEEARIAIRYPLPPSPFRPFREEDLKASKKEVSRARVSARRRRHCSKTGGEECRFVSGRGANRG